MTQCSNWIKLVYLFQSKVKFPKSPSSPVRVAWSSSFFQAFVCSQLGLSRRWKRHWLTLYAPSGIQPLPISLWLAFPDKGIINCYEFGAVRWFILGKVKPREIDEESINELNLFWEPHDKGLMLERLLKSFLRLHLNYYLWYAKRFMDFSYSLSLAVTAVACPGTPPHYKPAPLFHNEGGRVLLK